MTARNGSRTLARSLAPRSVAPIAVALAATALSAKSSAQDLIYQLEGDADGDEFGYSLAAAGDVNGDGVPDIVVGAPKNDFVGPDAGAAYVFSGADGSTIHTFYGDFFFDEFGFSVAGGGDVDGDGFDDVIVGAPRDDDNGTDSGSAWVFSGADGATLHTVFGSTASARFGYSVALVGDLDGDDRQEFAVGAPFDDGAGNNAGACTVFAGLDGQVVHASEGTPLDRHGRSIAALGDINDDSIPDWVVSSPKQSNGRAYVFSGSDGSTIHTLLESGSQFAEDVAAAGDLDHDGSMDILVSQPYETFGVVHAYSGASGNPLLQISAPYVSSDLGVTLDGDVDVNGDGYSVSPHS